MDIYVLVILKFKQIILKQFCFEINNMSILQLDLFCYAKSTCVFYGVHLTVVNIICDALQKKGPKFDFQVLIVSNAYWYDLLNSANQKFLLILDFL